jgi:hypothetical protein
MRSRIVRLGKAGLSMPEIAARCLVSWQVVRTILVPEEKPDPAPVEAPLRPATEAPSRGCQKAAERRPEQASTPSGEMVRESRTKVAAEPPRTVVHAPTKPDQAQPAEPQPPLPREVSRPVPDGESRILSEKPPRQPERVSAVSETEREKRAELVREAVAAGRVTKLPPGSAAGLSDIETRFHAAPLAVEQMKGAVGKRARMLAAGRNGRRRRLLK